MEGSKRVNRQNGHVHEEEYKYLEPIPGPRSEITWNVNKVLRCSYDVQSYR